MKKIGIIGCGIAGLALASLLKKSLDFDISIFEKDNIEDANVSGIQISPNGKKILSHLNFSNFQKDNFCSIKKISFFDMVSSSRISDMNLNYLKNESYITLNRSELIKFLIHEYSLSKNIIKQKVVSFDEKKIMDISQKIISQNNIKFKDFGQPIRLVLTNASQAPSIKDIVKILGISETVQRLKNYLN